MAVKRKYRLNLRNYGNLPAIMLSQYDEGYALEFEIRDGTEAASNLSAYTVTLKGTRADTLAYSFSGTISTNVLTFVIDTTMTACVGKGTAEIAIKDTANDVLFATFNMPVFVERAAVPEGSIDADVERAQEIAEQVQEIVDNAAAAVSGEAEKWATGQIDGTDVPSTDPTYENNAKYYAEQAADSAASIGIDATLTQAGKAADAKKTGDEITDLKSGLDTTFSWEDGFLSTTGKISKDTTYISKTSNIVPVREGMEIKYKIAYSQSRFSWFAYVTFDAKCRPIQRIVPVDSTIDTTSGTITIGSGVKYIRFSCRIWEDVYPTIEMSFSKVIGSEGDLFASINNNIVNNLYVPYSDSGYIDTNGTVASSDARIEYTTGFIPVSEGDVFYNFSKITDAQWMAYATYDSSKTFIARNTTLTGQFVKDSEYYAYQKIVVGSGTSYIRACTRTDGLKTFYFVKQGVSSITDKFISEQLKQYDADPVYVYQISKNSDMLAINHQGYNTIAPENTIPAFKLSRKMGFAYIETDVRFTSDDVPVLLHDETINRTGRNADGTSISSTVYIKDITYEQALTYDFGIWKGAQYAGTKIPTFEQLIKLCKMIGLVPVIELKITPYPSQEQVLNLVDICHSYGMERSVIWHSKSSSRMEYIKNYDASATIGLILDAITSDAISVMTPLKTATNKVFININQTELTDAFAESCLDAGLLLFVWTVDNANTIKSLNNYVTGVSSNYMNAALILYEDAMT